jgi:hypothetical protein
VGIAVSNGSMVEISYTMRPVRSSPPGLVPNAIPWLKMDAVATYTLETDNRPGLDISMKRESPEMYEMRWDSKKALFY